MAKIANLNNPETSSEHYNRTERAAQWGKTLVLALCAVVMFLKATKSKSQNRISLKQQRFLKNYKSESF